jgi:hypothetical protein
MHVLGWKWAKQTVSEIEAGRRAVRARELLGLALALDTTIVALTSAPVGMMAVVLPNGEPVGAYRITTPDGTFTWDGNRLKISPSARPGPLIDAAITEKRREAAELEAFRDHLRSGAPGEYAPAHPGDRGAANIRPYRTGEQPSEPLDE